MATSFYEQIIEEGKQIGLNQGEQIGLSKGEELKARQVIRQLDKEFSTITDQQLARIVNMPLAFVKKVRAEIKKKKS